MTAYYNENDPFCAEWLRRLALFGMIAPGDVDSRSIKDVKADDLKPYRQCHFFAGIGLWSLALQQAGWPEDREAWTGSCPCQPFSAAGKGFGFIDDRHLWPAWFPLIRERRPGSVFGEQVASPAGLDWFDLVSADLEGAGYAVGAADLCAAGVGAPHIRQRLWFVALAGEGRHLAADQAIRSRRAKPILGGVLVNPASEQEGLSRRAREQGGAGAGGLQHPEGDGREQRGSEPSERRPVGGRGPGGLADDDGNKSSEEQRNTGEVRGIPQAQREPKFCASVFGGDRSADELGHHHHQGPQIGSIPAIEPGTLRFEGSALGASKPLRGRWAGADWIWCRDGKYRPVEPGTFPLAHGYPGRVGKLRAYGNAICPEVASAFIAAAMECAP